MRYQAAACTICVLLFSCAPLPPYRAIRTPEVMLSGVRCDDVGTAGLTMTTDLSVRNPNAFPLYTAAIDYTLYLDGMKCGRGMRAKKMKIPPYESKTVRVPIQFSYVDMVSSVVHAIRYGTGAYRIDGEIVLRTAEGDRARAFESEGTVNVLGSP